LGVDIIEEGNMVEFLGALLGVAAVLILLFGAFFAMEWLRKR
jgi:hypothetical protein